ncbi:MAG: GntR family transcriptional regulator [Ruminococcaceae bacterium]|nr:GntR family transcriptional regulator [Oscillospiraceae bacterium]
MLLSNCTNRINTVNALKGGKQVININPKSGVPLFEQIRDEFKRCILMGVWSAGEQLPSVRALALELGINPNTIQRAYAELEREGLTYTVAGKGCFVEEDLSLLKKKKTDEAFTRLEDALTELMESGIGYDEIIDRINNLYKEVNNDKN